MNMSLSQCNYPECNKKQVKTFATVPLCEEHYENVQEETFKYYNERYGGGMVYEDRTHFHSISHLIPWSKVMKDVKG